MADRAGCRGAKRLTVFEEVHRFLDTWYFFISDCGFFYARPHRNRVSKSEFQAFINRLDMLCTGEVPNMIVVDLTDLTAKGQFWMRCKPLISKFAHRTNSIARFERHGSYAAVVIWRGRSNKPHRNRMQTLPAVIQGLGGINAS